MSLKKPLEEAVASQLVSDVPVGVFLSGGLDSGLIAHFAAAHAGYRVSSYSFSNAGYDDDEAAIASRYAERLGLKHQNVSIDLAREFEPLYERAVSAYEVPIAYPAAVPLFALAEQAARHNRVVLTGEGGDELLGGYTKYQVPRRITARTKIAAFQLMNAKKRAWQREWLDLCIFYQRYDRLLKPAGAVPYVDIPVHGADWLNHMLAFDQRNYLVSMLHKTDTMTMAHALEARVPYLDNGLVELSNALPARFKLRGGRTKWILRKIASKRLPEEYAKMPKRGFPVRFIEDLMWKNQESIIDGFASHPTVSERVDARELGHLKSKARAKSLDYVTLWIMKTYVDWYRMFFEEKVFLKPPTGASISVAANELPALQRK